MSNDDDSYKEELQALRVENQELKEIESKRVREQDFHKGTEVISLPQPWIFAVDAINLFKGLNESSKQLLEDNKPWRKVVFDITNRGQLKGCRPSEEVLEW